MSRDPSAGSPAGSRPGSPVARIRTTLDWVFRNRRTGKITVAQFPNASLGTFLVASLVRRFVHLTGTPRTLLTVVVTASLAWWAVDEIVRGVNPWRRFLGAAVLAVVVAGLVSHG